MQASVFGVLTNVSVLVTCWSPLSVTVEAQSLAPPVLHEVRAPLTAVRRLPCPSRFKVECAVT